MYDLASNECLFVYFAGLIPIKSQVESKKKYKCYGYKKLNHYYDEKTIKYAKLPINVD